MFNQNEAFGSIKDHKSKFPSEVEIRLLNPAKPQIGKITKEKLQAINSELRCLTKLNQLRSTNDAILWFNNMRNKKLKYFLVFDVVSFYPSISKIY